MKILNLYAGLGGNRRGWGDNHQVTAVEMEQDIADVYKANFPSDTVIVGDAHQYLLDHSDEFDLVWSSPPCQTHSKMMKATRHKKKRFTDMTLYQEIIFLQHFYKGKYVIENVKPFYKPLITPTTKLGRHYFWANFSINESFSLPNFKNFITAGTVAESEKMKEWFDIKYKGNIYYKNNHCPSQVLRNCVHHSMSKHIIDCLENNYKQQILF
jgi:DNA (cytosine-5)-methyltransferase 1